MLPLNYRERHSTGVLARKHCPRKALAYMEASSAPRDPLQILARSMQGRLPELVPIKYKRMAASAFGFFRGAACIMAADLAAQPSTGILTQICGDAHVANLGAFASQDGSLVFDLNDFDESTLGPFEWDVKRFATSLLLAGHDAGLDREICSEAVDGFTGSYTAAMRRFAKMPVVELARFQVHRLSHVDPIPAIFREADRSTPQLLLEKLTAPPQKKGQLRPFLSDPPLQRIVGGKEAEDVLVSLDAYAATLQPERRHFLHQYRPLQVAMRVVGTGSVGLRNYVVHFEAASRPVGADPLFLQVKQEPLPCYAAYLPESLVMQGNQGLRALNAQRAMQLVSDPFLGYTKIDGRDFLVRQFNDHKASLDLSNMDARTLRGYAGLCGEVLARGHARAGDAVAIDAYVGSATRFRAAIARFAHAYARKSREDWQTLRDWWRLQKRNG